MFSKKNQRGFTLVEMLIVALVVGGVGVIGATSFIGARQTNRTKAVALEVRTYLREIQNKSVALENNHGYAVRFRTDKKTITPERDKDISPFWESDTDNTPTYTLPPEFEFVNAPGQIVFAKRTGIASSGITFTIKGPKRSVDITIYANGNIQEGNVLPNP